MEQLTKKTVAPMNETAVAGQTPYERGRTRGLADRHSDVVTYQTPAEWRDYVRGFRDGQAELRRGTCTFFAVVSLDGKVLSVCTDEPIARDLRRDLQKGSDVCDVVPIPLNQPITSWDALL